MNNISKIMVAKIFTELMLICAEDNASGIEITITPPFGGRAKCRFEFEVELTEDKNDD